MEELEILDRREKKQHIWVEKYRPNKLSEYLGNESIKETFEQYIKNQDFPHVFFYGPPGTGKCLDFSEDIDIKIELTDDEAKDLKDFIV